MTGPPARRRPLPLPGDSGPSETHSFVCGVLHDTPTDGGVQGNPRLVAEWINAPSLNSRQRQKLEELGVTRESTERCGGIGWDRITTTGRLYAPLPVGEIAAISPVWAAAPSIYRAVPRPHLRDLIAWHPAEPETWWYRLGIDRLILGEIHYLEAMETGCALPVFATPLDWLKAAGEGAVFLTDVEARWAAEREADDTAENRLAVP